MSLPKPDPTVFSDAQEPRQVETIDLGALGRYRSRNRTRIPEHCMVCQPPNSPFPFVPPSKKWVKEES